MAIAFAKLNRAISVTNNPALLDLGAALIVYDDEGLPYDYETIQLNLIHPYNDETDEYPLLHEAIQIFPDILHPMDCLYSDNHLIITENGSETAKNKVHIYTNS